MGNLDFLDLDLTTNLDRETPLPDGIYTVVVERAEVEKTKSGRGTAVALGYIVDGGEYDGRWVWDRPLVTHESPKAQLIGRRHFASLLRALGLDSVPSDTEALLGLRVQVQVATEHSEGYGDQTKVIAYSQVPAESGDGICLDEIDRILGEFC